MVKNKSSRDAYQTEATWRFQINNLRDHQFRFRDSADVGKAAEQIIVKTSDKFLYFILYDVSPICMIIAYSTTRHVSLSCNYELCALSGAAYPRRQNII
jgi:hypothetical protein